MQNVSQYKVETAMIYAHTNVSTDTEKVIPKKIPKKYRMYKNDMLPCSHVLYLHSFPFDKQSRPSEIGPLIL